MKKIKAFSLIEILIGIMVLSIIGIFLLPASIKSYRDSKLIKEKAEIVFSLQAAIERSRTRTYGSYEDYINGKKINVYVSNYENDGVDSSNLVRIRASYGEKLSFELIKSKDEKGF